MIAERQKPGVTQRIVRDIERVREWIREHIRVRQKPELDEKVRSVDVKRLLRRRVILSLRGGAGVGFGRRLGAFGGRLGWSITRIFGF